MDLSPIAQSMFPQIAQPAQPPQAVQPLDPQQPEAPNQEQGDLNGKEVAKNQNKVEVEVQKKDQGVEKVTGSSSTQTSSVLDLPEAGLFKT